MSMEQSRELVVVIHGLSGSPASMAGVCQAIKDERPGAEFINLKMPWGRRFLSFFGLRTVFNSVSPERVIVDLVEEIDRRWAERDELGMPKFSRISFVGHSMGAVFARKLVLVAHGEITRDEPGTPEHGIVPAPFEKGLESLRRPRAWAGNIDRLVLIAGMNRGWSAADTVNWLTSVMFSLGNFVGEIKRVVSRRDPIVFAVRRGAPFLTQTRLQWLELVRDPARRPNASFQFIGTEDDIVSPADYLDAYVDFNDPASSGTASSAGAKQFRLVEMRFTNHQRAIVAAPTARMSKAEVDNARHRKQLIRAAFHADPDAQLGSAVIMLPELLDSLPEPVEPDVTDVVFVIHGIRDKGYWTQKIGARIKREFVSHHMGSSDAGDANAIARRIRSFTASYGYFAMLPFALGQVRRRKVEWLMDQYARLRALYPNATFSYVGHSNGTYLIASALELYPAARFKRVVLAGSIVRRAFDWDKLFASRHREAALLSIAANKDWVVGILSNGLSILTDIGSGGFRGFRQLNPRTKPPNREFHEVKYVVGGHGAGVTEPIWNDIARFIVHGAVPEAADPTYSTRPNWLRRFLYDLGSLIPLPLLTLVLAGGLYLLANMFITSPLACVLEFDCQAAIESWRILAFLAYFWVIYLIVTRW